MSTGDGELSKMAVVGAVALRQEISLSRGVFDHARVVRICVLMNPNPQEACFETSDRLNKKTPARRPGL